jgi:hypothetical protein
MGRKRDIPEAESPHFKPRLFYVRDDDDSVLQTHQHDVVYYGVVNLVDNNYIMGAVDVWRCRGCDQLFCEDKRYGMTDLAPEVGLPKIEPNTQWAALICTRDKGSNWTLTQVKPGMTITHSCTPDTKVELTVGPGYDLEAGPASGIGQHRIIVIEKFVNLPVDVQTGQKHTTTTNAYQALGKPFSFTPPLSATTIAPSRYNILNLTTLLFLATAVWGIVLAVSAAGFPQSLATELRILFALVAAGTLGSTYMLSKRRLWSPLLGLGAAAVGFLIYADAKIGPGFGIGDYSLSLLLLADIAAGWLARERLKGLIEKQWHPLDMPAYG